MLFSHVIDASCERFSSTCTGTATSARHRMITPSKHSHPDQTVIAAATVVLRQLRKKRAASYDELKQAVEKFSGSSDSLFTPAVSLLFLLGLLEYRPTVDIFEYG